MISDGPEKTYHGRMSPRVSTKAPRRDLNSPVTQGESPVGEGVLSSSSSRSFSSTSPRNTLDHVLSAYEELRNVYALALKRVRASTKLSKVNSTAGVWVINFDPFSPGLLLKS